MPGNKTFQISPPPIGGDDEAHDGDGGGDDGGCVCILHMLWRTYVKNIELNIYLMIFWLYVIGFSSTNIIMGYILDH